METIRLFIAVDISPDFLARADRLMRHLRDCPGVISWVKPENLHLTLKFLGETPVREIASVCGIVEQTVAKFTPFDIESERFGAFPNLKRPRTIWLGVEDASGKLETLQSAIEESLAQMGFRRENRRFKPHLTVGRVRKGSARDLEEIGKRIDEYEAPAPAVSDVSEVITYSSTLEKGGPIYEALGHAELQGTNSNE